ncbi:MAG: hypothetical protein QM775_30385 [Pirellulales bacterium]
MTRQSKFLWMKDLLEHMQSCHEQWQSADERRERILAESMRRDIQEFRRLCDSLEGEVDEHDERIPNAAPRLLRWVA